MALFSFFLSFQLSFKEFTMSDNTEKKLPLNFASALDFEGMQKALSELEDRASGNEIFQSYVASQRAICNETIISRCLNIAIRLCGEKKYAEMEEKLALARTYSNKTGFTLMGRVWEVIRTCYVEALTHNFKKGSVLV